MEQNVKDLGSKLIAHFATLKRAIEITEKLHYRQSTALAWLIKRLKLQYSLPHLRRWVASPDILLYLHELIMAKKPSLLLEFGSGASTLVIADALRQNNEGKLISLEHSEKYYQITRNNLAREGLLDWVDLRNSPLVAWDGEHINKEEEPLLWYDLTRLQDLSSVDLVFVDGPPAATCKYSRYPALPATVNMLSEDVIILMDDTVRQEEADICNEWARMYGFIVEYFPEYEKGLGQLQRPSAGEVKTVDQEVSISRFNDEVAGFDSERPDLLAQIAILEESVAFYKSLLADTRSEVDLLRNRVARKK